MLGVQGCKREKPPEDTFGLDTGINTNIALNVVEPTNVPPVSTNTVVYNPPVEPTNVVPNNPPPVPVEQPLVGGSEYKIAKGDTLAVIAKKNGVSLKALEAANPKLNPKKLKIGDKVTIPAATPKGVSVTTAGAATDGNSYTVKPGDTLGKIAKAHGTTVAAIKAANSLTTDRINVGKKLILPSKADATPVTPAPAPVVETVVPPPPAPSTNGFH
jgi:LysM repeat protein